MLCAGANFLSQIQRDPNRACKVRPFFTGQKYSESVQLKNLASSNLYKNPSRSSISLALGDLTLNVQMMRLSGVQQSIKSGARGGRFIFTPESSPTRRKSIDDVELSWGARGRCSCFCILATRQAVLFVPDALCQRIIGHSPTFYVCVCDRLRNKALRARRIHARTKYQRSHTQGS